MRITRNDLSDFKTNYISGIESQIDRLNELFAKIDSVINDNTLVGYVYFKLKGFWSENYVDTMKKLGSLVNDYKISVNGIYSVFSNYLANDDIIDESEVLKLKRQILELKNQIGELENLLANSESDHEELLNMISSLESEISKMEIKVKKIESLSSIDALARRKIPEISSELSTKIQNIPDRSKLGEGFLNSLEEFFNECSYGNKDSEVDYSIINEKLSELFSAEELDAINKAIADAINAAGFGTRYGAVAAAVTLVDIFLKYEKILPYVQIPGQGNGKYRNIGVNEEWVKDIISKSYGLDCSGFIQWVLLNAGYSVPKYFGTSNIYDIFGDYTYSFSEYTAIPGDLFIRVGNRNGESVGHVGMVIDIVKDNYGKEYYKVVEAAGFKIGIVYTYYPVDGEGWIKDDYKFCGIIDMSDFYANSPDLTQYIAQQNPVNLYPE